MSKFKQCMYTLVLIITCFVASPFIFKQIWQNSKVKAHVEESAEPSVNTENYSTNNIIATSPPSDNSEQQATGTAPDDAQVTANTTVSDAQTEITSQIVQSDPSYFDDALFIGDSRTVGLSEYGTLKNADYYCNIGLMACRVLTEKVGDKTLETFLSDKKYGKIYVMLGINEVGNDIEYTMSFYREMLGKIRELQPDAIIYLSANLHVAKSAQTAVITNDRINTLNSKIAGLAAEEGVFFIDVNGVFDDKDGNLNADYTSDGVHVLAKYYATWCEWLCANTVQVFSPSIP